MSLTASDKVALLSRKCSFRSICSINRNKEGRKEERGTWWMFQKQRNPLEHVFLFQFMVRSALQL